MPLPPGRTRRGHPDQALGTDRPQPERTGDGQQVADELLGRLIAPVAILGHQLDEDARQVRGDVGVELAHVGRRVLLMLEQLLEHRPIGKGRTSREHVKERASERIKVAPDVDVARVAGLFGADVVERAQGHPALGQAVVATAFETAGQAHVDELRPALGRDDDVRRLDVAMDDPALGGVHQGAGDLQREVDRLADRERTVALDPLADRRAFDVLEGDVVIPIVVADRVDPGDILVVESGRGAALLIESLDNLRIARLLGRKDLQGDVAIEPRRRARGRPRPCRRRRSRPRARTNRCARREAGARSV